MHSPSLSLKDMESELARARNRIRKLQKKSEGERQSASHRQALRDEVLSKKIALAHSLRTEEQGYEQNKREQEQRLKLLKKRNARMRHQQKMDVGNVMKALYFVKADDAREARRISEEHRDRIRQLNNSALEQNRERRQRIRSENGKVEQFWKDKFYRVYFENQAEKMQEERAVSSKQRELTQLLHQENNLQQELSLNSLAAAESRKQYYGLVSMPVRQVASLLQMHEKQSRYSEAEGRQKSGGSRSLRAREPQMEELELKAIMPKTQVNDTKLKIVLQRLRKR